MNYTFTDQFISDRDNARFLRATMMGPNAMRISEEMASFLAISGNSRILDLGCGMGLSTLLLARKYGASVFAADLWISPTENYERFKNSGIDDKAIPILADADKGLPFADEYFDILFSVDAYHYFGSNEEMLPSLIKYVKRGGHIAVAVPGLKHKFENGIPEEMRPFLPNNANFYTTGWWRNLWEKTDGIQIIVCREMDCCKQAWDEWLTSPSPYAQSDIEMIKTEDGRYFNLVQLIAKVK